MISTGKAFASLRAAQGKGDQSSMVVTETCNRMDCSKQMVTALGEEELCFEHFCARSYQLLESAANATERPREEAGCAEVLCRLNECARRAMEIALRQIELSNLERARLLDILLWSGDLISELRKRDNSRGRTGAQASTQGELQGLESGQSSRVN